MIRLFNIFLICVVFITKGYSQQLNFWSYAVQDGLSNSVANCIFQDSRGFIWIGTQYGLNRFDGKTFKVYNTIHNDTNSISNDWIYSITEDKDSNLWIATKSGLNHFNYLQNTFTRIKNSPVDLGKTAQYYFDITSLNDGRIVINAPPAILIYDPEKGSLSEFSHGIVNNTVNDLKIPILYDSQENVWVGTVRGLLLFSMQSKRFKQIAFVDKSGKPLPDSEVTALFRNARNETWVGTRNGLFKYNSDSEKCHEVSFQLSGVGSYSFQGQIIRAITEHKGTLYVGSEQNGLFVVSKYLSDSVLIQNYTSVNSELLHNFIHSLFIDKTDNLWVGTYQGINRANLKPPWFKLYRKSNTPYSVDLSGNIIGGLLKNDDGKIWVGTWRNGLSILDRKNNTVEHFSAEQQGNHYIPCDLIRFIYKDSDNSIWIGTCRGVLVFDKAKKKFVLWNEYVKKPKLPSFVNTAVFSIIRDKSSNYWMGTNDGLYKINVNESTVEIFRNDSSDHQKISANRVYSVLEDSEGIIWIATVQGLDAYNPLTKSMKHYSKEKDGLSTNFIISLCEGDNDDIWIGTNAFLNRFNKKDSTFGFYSQKDGVPDNKIYEVFKDKNNDLWLTTGNGICRFDKSTNSFQVFDKEHGLQDQDFNINAAFVGSDGEILVGGINGFNAFYPDSILQNPYIPELRFTSFEVTDGSGVKNLNIATNRKIVLNHQSNSFTIEFAALEYTNPRENNYKYRMLGISSKWVSIGNRNFVPFNAVSPGDYTFEIRGSNNDGKWNETGLSLEIVVLPPWWLSTYAFLAYAILLVLLIIVVIKFRERKLLRDKMALEQEVSKRTLQIKNQNELINHKNAELEKLNKTKDKFFSIIGHDLGNQFNTILGYSETLITDYRKMDAEKIENAAIGIYNTSAQAHELLENLLTWARLQRGSIRFNPQKLDVKALINNTVQLQQEAILKKDIQIKVEKGKQIFVYADKNMLASILRNLISNAIKFTHDFGEIVVSYKQESDFCAISIKDNGVGISQQKLNDLFKIDVNHSTFGTHGERGTGLGLILCKEFIETHKGKIRVESEPGKGSIFSFYLPLEK